MDEIRMLGSYAAGVIRGALLFLRRFGRNGATEHGPPGVGL